MCSLKRLRNNWYFFWTSWLPIVFLGEHVSRLVFPNAELAMEKFMQIDTIDNRH